MSRLVALPYSPWSEKARWALDHHRVPYRETEYVPMLGEPVLRAWAKQPFGKITVPVLEDGGRFYRDSLSIAEHAEQVGAGAPLFPADRRDDVLAWNERSEIALFAARERIMERLRTSPGAQEEALPPFIPAGARRPLRALAAVGVAFVANKHGTSSDLSAPNAALKTAVAGLRTGLGGRPYLAGAFSYADIAMAVVLEFVRPVSDAFIKLGPATREALSFPELADGYEDVLAWRDELYAKHRGT